MTRWSGRENGGEGVGVRRTTRRSNERSRDWNKRDKREGRAGAIAVADARAPRGRTGRADARASRNAARAAIEDEAADIGGPRVKDILFTARLVGADEALAIGLVNEVAEDAAAVAARADALAALLASHAPLTLQATKEGLRRIAEEGAAEAPEGERPGDDLILMTYMSEDFREGMEAFLGKRPPNFKGR